MWLIDCSMENTGNRPVCVIGATNRPDSIDVALRRSGRFDREIVIGQPDEQARTRILAVMASKLRVQGDLDWHALGKMTPGFVGADLQALVKEAAVLTVNRIFGQIGQQHVDEAKSYETTSTLFCVNVLSDALSYFRLREGASDALRAIEGALTPEQLAPLAITMDDFTAALKIVRQMDIK